jgi:hypothetical protein
MAQNDIDADAAFALLKSYSQQSGQKLIDVAEAVTQTHRLLPAAPPAKGGESANSHAN